MIMKKRDPARATMTLKAMRYREVPGVYYGTPKELWALSLPPQKGSPQQVARAALAANASLLGIDPEFRNLALRHVKRTPAGWHVIFGQRHLGTPIHRAYVTIHMNRDKAIYLIKNRAVPARLLPVETGERVSEARARRIGAASVKGRLKRVLSSERMWFPIENRLRFAFKFRLRRQHPREEWLIYVDASTGRILSRYDNLATATARARVFNPNPVVALGDWAPLLQDDRPVRRLPPEAYESVRLYGLSPSGRLDGPRVTTRPTKNRMRASTRRFDMWSHERGFEAVMAYYHVDAAVRYVRSLGYTGPRAIFRRPVAINARATAEDESWYSPGTRLLGFGTGDVDDAEDGETILHEFAHALQDAICPDFGQSPEAAAMGEGFGDYFAASFFAAKKLDRRRRRFVAAVMTWDGILFDSPSNANRPPCVRRVDSRRSYETFDHAEDADEHDNGEIWSATLWDIWRSVGRAVADAIIIESHFQLDGFTTFARGARAILDADRHLFGGQHVARLKRVFRRRGIGPIE
jgi:hypothetical protein